MYCSGPWLPSRLEPLPEVVDQVLLSLHGVGAVDVQALLPELRVSLTIDGPGLKQTFCLKDLVRLQVKVGPLKM